MPVCGVVRDGAELEVVPKRRSIESGSTPEAASRTRATIVGRPDEMRRRDQLDVRRLDVVHPGAQPVRACERSAGEEVAAGVHGDVVPPGRQHDAARGADVEQEVWHQAVRVDRYARIALDVVLVERAQEPGMDRGVRAQLRRDPGVEPDRRSLDDDAGVDRLARDVQRVDRSPCRRRSPTGRRRRSTRMPNGDVGHRYTRARSSPPVAVLPVWFALRESYGSRSAAAA